MPEPAIEIEAVQPARLSEFWRTGERDGLSELYGFRVVWHEQQHEFAATESGAVVGGVRIRIAASLATLVALSVIPGRRTSGVGRALLARCEEVANYYNCHKVTVQVPAGSVARIFFEACGYKLEAILPQHTFKLDVAVLRKFLL